jgi:pyruvate dehydrogenase E2 component (dihydrolipoamide acetyltransferase)
MAKQDVLVPDLGDFKDVPVIAVLVKPGDKVEVETPLITLESDKATIDVPSPAAGVIGELRVKVGDKVSQGTAVLSLETASEAPAGGAQQETAQPAKASSAAAAQEPEKSAADAGPAVAGARAPGAAKSEPAKSGQSSPEQAKSEQGRSEPASGESAAARPPPAAIDEAGFHTAHAGPGVRRLARELGVDLARLKGQGPKGRILKEDVHAYVKAALSGAAPAGAASASGGLAVAPLAKIDFAKFGPVERKPLTRIQKIAGPLLHRNWVTIPHVTNCEDADITDLEAFRVELNKESAKEKDAVKLTMLAFLVKACISALQKYPTFNSSLDGDALVLKHYYNIAFAADTPQGLVVPVIKDADKKGVLAIARESAELAAKARDGKLAPADLQGATFTISSLGGIGGTYFTPIINAPEVAILGVCRAAMRPVWNGTEFGPRLILPLSLSWDHRVVDGALAARFNAHLAAVLADARRLLL